MANAALIAAAPDLLAALRSAKASLCFALAGLDSDDCDTSGIEQSIAMANAAIAKAAA